MVRAEFLRARNFEYVNAARALGVPNLTIMFRHLLPNAMVATLTFLPFILNGSITTLTSLDFLGFGLPPGSASLGELLRQGQRNLNAPWLGISGFVVISLMLSLLIFIGEATRDAFDPRKTFRVSELPCSRSAISPSPSRRAARPVDRRRPHLVRHRQGRDGGAGRRIRLRQIRHGALGPEAPALPVRQPSVGQDHIR